jgi:RNA polymerase sigma-70 factor (ECF subfamily)
VSPVDAAVDAGTDVPYGSLSAATVTAMEDPVELQRLLSRVALGDRKAFRTLYDATSPSLFGVAVRILNRRDRAEEAIQDAFVSVWQRASSYSDALSRPMTWLTAIVRNRALDMLRSESARPAQSLNDEDTGDVDEPADERPDPLALLERAADEVRIRDCLGDIRGPQRQCLALAYYHGLSHSEVAAQLAAPIGSVKVWIRRALDRLKRCLDRTP